MNANLLNIVKRIISEKGENILADPQKLKALFSDYAKDEPKEERIAFGRCIEIGSYRELKSASSINERQRRKTVLIGQLNAKYGIDKSRCTGALDLLEAAIFNETTTPTQGNAPVPVYPAARPPAPVSPKVPSPTPVTPAAPPSAPVYPSAPPPITINNIVQNNVPNRRLRHGFTSFYLWLSFLGSAAMTIFLAFDLMAGLNILELMEIFSFYTSADLWVIRINSLATSIALYSIITWKRWGFWMYCVVCIVTSFLNPYKIGFLYSMITYAISIGIIYGVLHFKNAYNAKSTWEQME